MPIHTPKFGYGARPVGDGVVVPQKTSVQPRFSFVLGPSQYHISRHLIKFFSSSELVSIEKDLGDRESGKLQLPNAGAAVEVGGIKRKVNIDGLKCRKFSPPLQELFSRCDYLIIVLPLARGRAVRTDFFEDFISWLRPAFLDQIPGNGFVPDVEVLEFRDPNQRQQN